MDFQPTIKVMAAAVEGKGVVGHAEEGTWNDKRAATCRVEANCAPEVEKEVEEEDIDIDIALFQLRGHRAGGGTQQTREERTTVMDDTSDAAFLSYLAKWGKAYPDKDEHMKRRNIFTSSLLEIVEHNKNPTRTWTKGLTRFADLSNEERLAYTGGGYTRDRRSGSAGGHATVAEIMTREWPMFDEASNSHITLPTSIDWRKEATVRVRDQGRCGSCWVHAAVATMEFQLKMNHSKAVKGQNLMEVDSSDPDLSINELVSCTTNPKKCGGTGGCEGATETIAFDYVKKNGIVTDADDPYEASAGHDCLENPKKPVVGIESYKLLPENGKVALMRAVAQHGPVAVSIDAGPLALYNSGVISNCPMDDNVDVNHAVTLIGWGSTRSGGRPIDYWTLMNSWGPNWGENGHFRLQRHSEEPCGWDKTPQDGSECAVEFGGRAKVKVCGECGVLSSSAHPIGTHLLTM